MVGRDRRGDRLLVGHAGRVLDPATPLQLALSPDGATVYSVVDLPPANGDSVVLRRRPVSGGAPEQLGAAPDGTPITFVLSLDGDWLAWARAGADPMDPGPLVLRHLSTGDTLEVGIGTPEAIAPDGSQVLYRPDPASSALRWWDRAARTDSPFNPFFSTPAGPAAWRWSGSDPSALWDHGSPAVSVVWTQFHNLGSGTTYLSVFQSADTIDVRPPFWSPDGSRAAVWTRRTSRFATEHLLYVFDVFGALRAVVATGTDEPGAATFSSDASRIAQIFGERLFVSNAATNPGAVATRHSHNP